MADNQFEQAAPAPEAQIPAAQEPGLYAIHYLDNWDGESDTYYLVAERTKDGRWLNNESGCELLKYQGDAVLEVWPLTSGTTSDKYRAELYDEAWEKARSMGYGNVTMALAELERLQAAQGPVRGCDYHGAHFGAAYPDAQCHEGYLWDEDSCDEPGGPLRSGGDIPCPQCNAAEYAEYLRGDDDDAPPAAEQPDAVRELLRMAWRLIPSAEGMTEAQQAEHAAWHMAASALLGKDGEA